MQEPISQPSKSKLSKFYSVYQVTSIRFPHADDKQIVFILDASSETKGQSVVGPEEKSATKVFSLFKRGRKGSSARAWKLWSRLFSRPDWLPLGLRGWTRRGLKNVCVERFEVTDTQRDLKVELTLLTSVPGSPFMFHIAGGRGTPYNGLHREAPPEKGSFFSLSCKRVGVY